MRTVEQANDGLIDIEAVASRLGQTDRFVRRLVEEKRHRRFRRLTAQLRIPHYDICGKIRFTPNEIQAWLDERTARAGDPTRRGRP